MKGRILHGGNKKLAMLALSSAFCVMAVSPVSVQAAYVSQGGIETCAGLSAKEAYVDADMVIAVPKFCKGHKENAMEELLAEQDGLYSCKNVRNDIVEMALSYVGNRYISGGTSLEKGTDCSGFTRLIYGEYGYWIGRVANDQYRNVTPISYEDLKPGDLVFYGSKVHATHVAMYIGDGKIVHAANSRRGITTDQIDYMKNLIGYGRVIDYYEENPFLIASDDGQIENLAEVEEVSFEEE